MADSQKKSYNLFDNTITTTTNHGVTFTVNPDKSITAVGTATGGNAYVQQSISLPAGKYYVSGCVGGWANTYHIIFDNPTGGSAYQVNDQVKLEPTENYTSNFIIRVMSGQKVNTTFYPMIREQTVTDTTYVPYSSTGWVHSLRKMSSATEQITTGQTIYANGQPITTYSIKGNTTQSGTPTPSNPVMPQGTGDRTDNLLNNNPATQGNGYIDNALLQADGTTYSVNAFWITEYIPVSQGDYYYYNDLSRSSFAYINFYDSNKNRVSSVLQKAVMTQETFNLTQLTIPSGVSYIRMSIDKQSTLNCLYDKQLSSYIPYGYKIPILTNQGSAVNYLGSVQSTRQIGKYVCTGDEDWKKSSTYQGSFYCYALAENALITQALCSHATYTVIGQSTYIYGTFAIEGTTVNKTIDLFLGEASWSVNDFKAYLQAQYVAGTPVTIWYVLATATTGTVNEPLMKIGDYSDSISNATAIPTADGANTISVDTTVQPSEFTATWTGWHDAYVKEKSENLIPTNVTDYEQGSISSTDGTNTDSTTRIRSIDYYPIDGDTNYYITVDNSNYCYLNLLFYDNNKQFVGQYYTIDGNINGATSLLININSAIVPNVKYYRVTLRKADNTTITAQDIDTIKPMINLGSTAQTYAPYWE